MFATESEIGWNIGWNERSLQLEIYLSSGQSKSISQTKQKHFHNRLHANGKFRVKHVAVKISIRKSESPLYALDQAQVSLFTIASNHACHLESGRGLELEQRSFKAGVDKVHRPKQRSGIGTAMDCWN